MLIFTGSAISLAGYIFAIGIVLTFTFLDCHVRARVFGKCCLLYAQWELLCLIIMPQRYEIRQLVFYFHQNSAMPTDLVGDGYETKTVEIINPDKSITTTTIRQKNA
jgi:hypothetical protein